MRHSRKSTRVISLINQLQPGINVNEENQPVTRGGRGEEEERRKRREPVAPCFLRRVNTHWIDSMGHFFSLLLLFFFFPVFSKQFLNMDVERVPHVLDSRRTIQFCIHFLPTDPDTIRVENC